MMSSRTERQRKKKYRGRERGKKGEPAGQGDIARIDGVREQDNERKTEKIRKRTEGTARGEKKGDRDLARDRERRSRNRRK